MPANHPPNSTQEATQEKIDALSGDINSLAKTLRVDRDKVYKRRCVRDSGERTARHNAMHPYHPVLCLSSNLHTQNQNKTTNRQELVSGKALPTQEELQDWQEQHAHQQHDEGGGGGGGASFKGVPYYWLTVLCNQVHQGEQGAVW